MTSSIEFRDVTKSFVTRDREVVALNKVNLTVEQGEFVTIVGPSGCGKTTLLRLIAGLEEATSGEILLGGESLRGGRGRAGMVFQEATLLPWLTVLDNVLLPAKLTRTLGREKRELAFHLLHIAQLDTFVKSYPRQLSGGMQQRVGICRALLAEPDVLLMDEPFGALDAMTRDHLNIKLQELIEGTGKTVVFITHSIPEAVVLGDRVVVMTPSPGEIRDEIRVPLPRVRQPEIVTTPPGSDIDRTIRAYFKRHGDDGNA